MSDARPGAADGIAAAGANRLTRVRAKARARDMAEARGRSGRYPRNPNLQLPPVQACKVWPPSHDPKDAHPASP